MPYDTLPVQIYLILRVLLMPKGDIRRLFLRVLFDRKHNPSTHYMLYRRLNKIEWPNIPIWLHTGMCLFEGSYARFIAIWLYFYS